MQGGLLAGLTSPGHPIRAGGPGGAKTGPSSPTVVALFLAGRLVSHVAAGALLGLAGSAVQPGPQVRAALLVAAGIAVAVFGIRMFGREPDGGCERGGHKDRHEPHGGHKDRHEPHGGHEARHEITAPAPRALALGAATILLPCGVTLSTEMLAVSSGSALGGIAVMVGFVAGTAPAFALLGLVLRRTAGTRLAAVAGVVALAAGLWTVSSGLSLGGWLPGSGGPARAASGPGSGGGNGGTQRIDVWATPGGYRPGVVAARAGTPVELVFHLEGAPGCTRTLTIEGRDVALPATVRLGTRSAGSLRYVCSMGMYVGFVNFV